MAGYGSGTGSSAMLTVGLVIGQSCRWSFDQAADAMGCLLAKDRESSPSDHFLIFFLADKKQHEVENARTMCLRRSLLP